VGRGRIYLPLDELAMFRVPEQDVLDGRVTAEFVDLMKFQIDRAHALYRQAEACIPLLPGYAQAPVMIALRLYERILDRIVRRNFDVFSGRARTSRLEKVSVALRVVVGHKVGKL
jgi:phytoene synthase